MRMRHCIGAAAVALAGVLAVPVSAGQQGAIPADSARVTALKQEVAAEVEKMRDFTQQMVDQIFSFGELGFQEVETHKYLTTLLRQHGFTVEEGVAGIPTAFMASWGSGKPVIALGSDIDGIPQSSQKPGVGYQAPRWVTRCGVNPVSSSHSRTTAVSADSPGSRLPAGSSQIHFAITGRYWRMTMTLVGVDWARMTTDPR